MVLRVKNGVMMMMMTFITRSGGYHVFTFSGYSRHFFIFSLGSCRVVNKEFP